MRLPRRRLLAAALPMALGACGFELRRPPELPFSRMALSGFAPRSPLYDELKRSMPANVQLVEDPNRAEVVLYALIDRREKSVTASTAAGQVRGVQLRVHFEYRLSTPAGRELIPDSTLLLSRDMTYSENIALAKEQEELRLYQAMQTDIVRQLMRRISQVKKA